MTNKGLCRKGYEVGKTIGEGAYSKVKVATSQKHGSEVAIKILNRGTASRDFVKKFLPRELALLRAVKHDHIILMHEILVFSNRKVCIVMERAAADLMYKIQQVNRIPVDESRTMFTQIVSAVDYLHQNNIVHRDLKCENVLLTADNQVKIADFGFGKFAVAFPELSRTFCGTATYAPPEVLLGIPYDPKKHDIWSIGVILYVMVTGCLPYDDSNIHRLPIAQRRPVVYPVEAVVPDTCRAFISFLLHVRPATRPSIQQVVQHPWLQQPADQTTV